MMVCSEAMMKNVVTPVLSTLVLLALWAILALILHSRYLPAPSEVAAAFAFELSSGQLLYHIGITFLRVTSAFAVAMTVGTGLGLALGRNAKANRFFDPWLILALNIPALVTIVFCYLWIGINEAAAITAVALNKIPNTAITIREGARALDPGFEDVARVYRLTGWHKFRHVLWPQLEPYMAASVRSGLALIWKIVLIVELIGRSNGIGFQINLFFGQFDLARILVYTLSFMAVVFTIEALAIKPWETRARAWRGE
jgi:NitT/TauT family transport system permease protein